MRKAVETLIEEMKSKLSGYAVLLNFRYMNLCIKAEAMSLLMLTITDDEDEEQNIEDVAGVMLANDYAFEIIPNEPKLIFPICKALLEAHPEFKQEVVKSSEENRMDDENEEEQHIICTMPEVNEERHDYLLDRVAVLYDSCKLDLEKTHAAYTVKLTEKMLGQKIEDIKEAEDALEEGYKMHADLVDGYRSAKEKEIEDAYQKWLTEQQKKAEKEAEKAAARGETAGMGFSLFNNDQQEDE